MDYSPLELKLISAKDLKDVNLFSKMDVYAVVSISGDPCQNHQVTTPVDTYGGTSPTWNFPMIFNIDESLARQNRLSLEIKLKSVDDKDIGVVHVPVKELLDKTGRKKSEQFVSYEVTSPSGKIKGSLNFSCKFGDPPAYGGYPPPPYQGGYPPAYGGYPPPPYQGGYPPAYGGYPPPENKKSKMGSAALWVGKVAGALLIGVVSGFLGVDVIDS